MTSALTSAIVAAVLCVAVFSCFGGLMAYLYIAEQRKLRRRAAAARNTPEGRRRRRRAQYPDALPAPSDVKVSEPALGNVVIKDEDALAALHRDLIPVAVSVRGGDGGVSACSVEESPQEGVVDRNTFVEVLDTSAIPAEERMSCTGASVARSFRKSLLSGGYVIVECEVPPSMSLTGGHSTASAMSSVGPRDEEMMEVDGDASVTVKTSITQYFRFHRSTNPYGTAQYVVAQSKKSTERS